MVFCFFEVSVKMFGFINLKMKYWIKLCWFFVNIRFINLFLSCIIRNVCGGYLYSCMVDFLNRVVEFI